LQNIQPVLFIIISMGILQTIVSRKKRLLRDAQSAVPLRELKAKIADAEKVRDFGKAIKRLPDGTLRLIAEIKRASPSEGIIREPFDHRAIARIYEERYVHALSVLTEESFFMGDITFLSDVKTITTKPVLRKDFIVDEYQIYESRACKADAVLLIAAILEKNQAAEYLHLAADLGMSVLFEVHNMHELEMALDIDSLIVGVNNRDLHTLKTDLNTTFALRREIPADKIVVAESGIRSRNDVRRLREIGVDAMLIGTSLMQADDIAEKIDELMKPM